MKRTVKITKYLIGFIASIFGFVTIGIAISIIIAKISMISFNNVNTMVASTMGPVVTLIGIVITIQETNKQNKKCMKIRLKHMNNH